MCGRYTAAKDFGELIKLMGIVMARVPFFAPRYNIAPIQLAPVIFHDHNQPAMKLMRWGLIPSWAKDESTVMRSSMLGWKRLKAGQPFVRRSSIGGA